MRKAFFALAWMIIIAGGAAAAELEDFSIAARVSYDNPSHVVMVLSVDKFSGDVKISIPHETSGLKYEADFGKISCSSKGQIYGTDILCSLPQNASGAFKVELDIYDLVKSSDEQFFFKQDISMPLDSKKFSFKAVLPDGMGISTSGEGFFPKDADISSDGRNIFISWSKPSVKFGETFSAQVIYEPLSKGSGGPSGF